LKHVISWEKRAGSLMVEFL